MKITANEFRRRIGGVFTRVDHTGYVRVWGHLIADAERTVTFWRHARDQDFTFKVLETYAVASPLADLEDAKTAKGYSAIELRSVAGRRLLREVMTAFIQASREDAFHFVAPPRSQT